MRYREEEFYGSLCSFALWPLVLAHPEVRAARYREAADSLKAAASISLMTSGLAPPRAIADTCSRTRSRPRTSGTPQRLHRPHFAPLCLAQRVLQIHRRRTHPAASGDRNKPACHSVPSPAQPFFAPIAARVAAVVTAGLNSISSLSSFWSSESSGLSAISAGRAGECPRCLPQRESPVPLAPNSKRKSSKPPGRARRPRGYCAAISSTSME